MSNLIKLRKNMGLFFTKLKIPRQRTHAHALEYISRIPSLATPCLVVKIALSLLSGITYTWLCYAPLGTDSLFSGTLLLAPLL